MQSQAACPYRLPRKLAGHRILPSVLAQRHSRCQLVERFVLRSSLDDGGSGCPNPGMSVLDAVSSGSSSSIKYLGLFLATALIDKIALW